MVKLIQKFYEDFHHLDAESMATAYHKDIIFFDPAFGTLHGQRASNMWRMLCASQKGKTFEVTLKDVLCNDNLATAKWEARYIFSKTGRPVHNIISASFKIEEGIIIEHHDHFSLHKWASQAMGTKGKLLGWTPVFKYQLQKQTNLMLDKFEASRSGS